MASPSLRCIDRRLVEPGTIGDRHSTSAQSRAAAPNAHQLRICRGAVARTDALRDRGFDERRAQAKTSTWRLDAGYRRCYEPASTVHHHRDERDAPANGSPTAGPLRH
jgi:hypothetical protein